VQIILCGYWKGAFTQEALHKHLRSCEERTNQPTCHFIMSDSFHRIPALSKWALKGKQRKMEVTQEELQVQKKGAG